MITTPSPTDLDTAWHSRVRAALVLATWADQQAAHPEAGPATSPGDDRSSAMPLTRLGARIRSMWVLAEHLSRHDGVVLQAELGHALVGQRQPSRVRAVGAPTAAPSRTTHARSWSSTATGNRGLPGRTGPGFTVPVGLVRGVPLTTVAQRARRAAALTQPHPQALDVAAMQAVAVAVVARTTAGAVTGDAVIGQITRHVRSPELHAALRRVPLLARQPTSPQRVAMQLHALPPGASAVPAALTAFLLNMDDPGAAIRFAAQCGGDPRAAAVVTGALCGVRHGSRALPESLDVPARLGRIADALAGLPAGT